jgi:hypothetical protein
LRQILFGAFAAGFGIRSSGGSSRILVGSKDLLGGHRLFGAATSGLAIQQVGLYNGYPLNWRSGSACADTHGAARSKGTTIASNDSGCRRNLNIVVVITIIIIYVVTIVAPGIGKVCLVRPLGQGIQATARASRRCG